VSLVVLLLEVVGVHFVGHVSAQDDGLVVFDEKTCGTVKKIVTSETKAEDLVNVTWCYLSFTFLEKPNNINNTIIPTRITTTIDCCRNDLSNRWRTSRHLENMWSNSRNSQRQLHNCGGLTLFFLNSPPFATQAVRLPFVLEHSL